jgi:UDP-N-acetyl-D-galactosamine dehydrogenase
VDFSVGYSPERINPGDKVRRLPDIVKVVSGDTPASAQRIASLYSQVISAGVHVATSIKVAEAAKVIENTQRDLLIALTNELAIIFERLGIDTREVLEAASTKWNFVKLKPGLVGGHCISVDPYYLLYKSETAGYVPSLIHAGRRINEHMPIFIANRLARLVPRGRVLVVGFAFKDNCSDIRNSKVFDLYCELLQRGYSVDVVDARVDPQMVIAEYGVSLSANVGIEEYDGVVYCVNHEEHQNLMMSWRDVLESKATVVFDVSGNLKPVFLGTGVRYVTW